MSNIKPIEELIPHRSPFLFVDSIDSATRETITGHKTFLPTEPFFAGHFPGHPVVPGVILIEAMAQCGGAGLKILTSAGNEGLFFLAEVSKARFRKQVLPGDKVTFRITNLRLPEKPIMIKQKGVCFVQDSVASEAEWTCLLQNTAK